MRRALTGLSGIMEGLDYRGVEVLAAYEPISEMGVGIVAKVDKAEIRAAFVPPVLWALLATTALVGVGLVVFRRVGDPLVKELRAHAGDLEEQISERVRAERELNAQLLVRAAMVELAKALVDPGNDVVAIAKIVRRHVVALTGSQHGYVGVIDTDTGDLVTYTLTAMMGGSCQAQGVDRRTVFPMAKDGTYPALWGVSLNERAGMYTNDPPRHPSSTGTPEGHIPLTSFLSAPACIGSNTLGQIAVSNADNGYTEKDLATVERFASLFALAIQNMRSREALRIAKDAAEAANRAKTEFLAKMSHELRTPLNAIIGFSDALADEYIGPLTSEQQELVADILSSGRHLLLLINDVLDLSKIEAGRTILSLSDVPICATIAESLYIVRRRVTDRGVDLTYECCPSLKEATIQADEVRLKQILYNLLSNAAKFTPDGGHIHVSVQRDEEAVVVRVADDGRGIAPEHHASIFEPFTQGQEDESNVDGTGLGLHVCRELVELHGGSIQVESGGKGRGSTFIVTLPVSQTAEVAASTGPSRNLGDGEAL